jgi:rubrerythrin
LHPFQDREAAMNDKIVEKQVHDLLCQALETEQGGVAVYQMAVLCAHDDELREEWERYLEQTERHVEILRDLFEELSMDPEATTPGRLIVRDKGQALVSAMRKALKSAPWMAQVVAAECVVDAETKDHLNWQLIGELAQSLDGSVAEALAAAHEQVEAEEDEHLHHSRGWCRELWFDAVGLTAVLPPPEEEDDVRGAAEAARVEEKRKGPRKKNEDSQSERRRVTTSPRKS